MDRFIGIDCGSSFCKGALFVDGHLRALARRPTGWNAAESGWLIIEELLSKAPPRAEDGRLFITATGYGRENIPNASRVITEISAHALGVEYLCPGTRTFIDIGGQDSKLVSVEGGRVRDFMMNDKCAAGSGRFLEMVRTRLELDSTQTEELLASGKEAVLNSTCVVFAESEIIGLLASGASREEILGGAAAAMAKRVAALAGHIAVIHPAVLTGGLSESPGLCGKLSRELGGELSPLPRGIYSGAIGAALSGMERPVKAIPTA
jgi:predicted CoA-substrate-specific enzyme activase